MGTASCPRSASPENPREGNTLQSSYQLWYRILQGFNHKVQLKFLIAGIRFPDLGKSGTIQRIKKPGRLKNPQRPGPAFMGRDLQPKSRRAGLLPPYYPIYCELCFTASDFYLRAPQPKTKVATPSHPITPTPGMMGTPASQKVRAVRRSPFAHPLSSAVLFYGITQNNGVSDIFHRLASLLALTLQNDISLALADLQITL